MNIDQIKTFLLVAKKGSLSAAAVELELNQTTLGRQIKELEKQAGFPLLERTFRGFVLTEQGKKFYDLCLKLVAQLEHETICIKESGKEVQGTLSIVIGLGTFNQIVSALSDFVNANQKINLKFNTVLDFFKIQTGETDGLLLPSESVLDLGLIEHHIFNDEFRIYAKKNYLEKNGYPKTFQDLKNHRILIYKDSENNSVFNKINMHLSYLKAENIPIQSYLEVNSGLALEAALHSGLGVGVYWKAKIENSESLVDLFPDVPSSIVPYSFCYHPRLKDSQKIKAFLDFLINFFAKYNK